jgi:hypothetical protein
LSIGADWSAETFVHEVGHSQGRLHVECNGMEGGPDPTYPFDGGDIGEWGFGVIDFGLRHPTFYKDYMTYCHPTWVSTWGWNKVFPVIRELSKWETQSRPADPYNGSLLVGRLLPDGRETWRTVPGNLGPATFTDDVRIQFTARSGRVWTQPTLVQAMPEDDGSRLIYTPLPDDFDRVTRLRRLQNGQRIAIERDAVRERHHLRTVFAKPQMRSGAR